MTRYLTTLLMLLCPISLIGQNMDLFTSYSKLLSPEKVYVQTDKEKYAIGDTIWFSAFLKNASELSEYAECNYVYAEIIAETFEPSTYTGGRYVNKVLQRVKLKRSDNGFSGHFVVDEPFNTGLATLRAYSYWMLNQPPQLLFYKTLEIFNPLKDQYISNLIEAGLRDDDNFNDVGYDNPFRKNPLKPKDKKEFTVRLTPESGSYIPNTRTRFGAKVTGSDGAGAKCKVNVFCDGAKQPLLSFETNDNGIAVFEMTVPDGVKSLQAGIESEGEKLVCKSDIPLPDQRAVVITAQPDTAGITADIKSLMMDSGDSLFVLIFDKSEIYFRDTLDGPHSVFRFPYDKLTEGINSLAVIDSRNNVLAERKFFVFPQQKFNVASSVQTRDAKDGEIVSVSLDVSNLKNAAVNGSVSVSVTDGYLAPSSRLSHNILSYFLLGSESEEMIQDPQRFFDESVNSFERIKAADSLMLAQNFDYYKIGEIVNGRNKMPHFGREFTQSLSGYVTGPFGMKARSSTVCFAAPSINFFFIGDLDSCAFFVLNELDFPDSTQFLVGAQGQKRLFKKWYAPVINPDHFAGECNYPKYFRASGYSEQYSDDFLREYYTEGGEPLYTIRPARITATPSNFSPFPNDNFKSNEYLSGKQLIPYQSYTVKELLLEVAHLRTSPEGLLSYRATMNEGFSLRQLMKEGTSGTVVKWKPVHTYINGMRGAAGELNTMMVDQVEAVGWKQGVEGSKYGFFMGDFLGPATTVFVKMKKPDTSPYNTTFGKPIGWQKPASFDNGVEGKAREGIRRTTLFWDPSKRIDDGRLELEFFKRKNGNPCVITVEGLLDNGQPFSYSRQL